MTYQFDPILGTGRDGKVTLAEQQAGFNTGTAAQQAAFQASVSGGDPTGMPAAWTAVKLTAVGPAAGWAVNGLGYGSKLLWDHQAGKYALLTTGTASNNCFTIGLYYSDDLVSWTPYASNPVMPRGNVGDWDFGGVGTPDVIWDGSIWHMFYEGFNTIGFEAGESNIGHATATTLTGPWTKDPAPIIRASSYPWVGVGGAMYHPTLVKDGSGWSIFFNGGLAPGAENIGKATAPSLSGPWTPLVTPAIDRTVISAGSALADPVVYKSGDIYYMQIWDSGAGKGNVSWMFSATTPAGPWTKLRSWVWTTYAGSVPVRPCIASFSGRLVMIAQNGNTNTGLDVYLPSSEVSLGLVERIGNRRKTFDVGNSWGTVDMAKDGARVMYWGVDPTGRFPVIGIATGTAGVETERVLLGFDRTKGNSFVALGSADGGTSVPALSWVSGRLEFVTANNAQKIPIVSAYNVNVPTTVSGLPAAGTAGAGARAYVTDATSATFGAPAVGGGGNGVPVWCNSTSWFVG